MTQKFSTDPLKGMDDFFPPDMRLLNYIVDVLKEVAERYGYEEYEAPALEPIEIFAAKSSDELVNEQSFIVERKKDDRLILRPEITPSLARMVAKKSQELKKPIRWYSNPRLYRYEQPQKGRRREFFQFNVDILGEDSLYAELEIFNIIVDIFNSLDANSTQFQVLYNSRRFIDAVCEQIIQIPLEKIPLVYKVIDKAEKMEESEFEKFVIDAFQEESIIQGVTKLAKATSFEDLLKRFGTIPESFFKSKGYLELEKFKTLLSNTNLARYCKFSSNIVRGLDYYTGIVFEVFDTGTENKRSIFGGGRYDDLLNLFSDEKISGIGFGMGILMLTLFLQTYDLIPDEVYEKDYTDTIYIATIDESVADYAIKLAQIIRDDDIPSIIDYRFSSLKSQLSKANELGVLVTLIIGPKEMEENKLTIKNMKTQKQKVIDVDALLDEIYDILEKYADN